MPPNSQQANMNNNNMNDNKNNNRKFGDDRSNAPRRPPPPPTTSNSNSYNLNPPRPRQTANRGNRGVGDIVAGQRGTAQAGTGGPPRTNTGQRLTNSAVPTWVQPIVIGNGRSVFQSAAPPNENIRFILNPNVGNFRPNRLLVASVATTTLSDGSRMVTASVGENSVHTIFPEGVGLVLKDKNYLGSTTLYLGGPGRIISDASLNIWLIFHILGKVEELGGTYLHLSCDESTRRSFGAGVGQDLDFDSVKTKALVFCANKNMLFSIGKESPVIPSIVSDTDKKLATALDKVKTLETSKVNLTRRCNNAEAALKESLSDNHHLREEMARLANVLSELSVQPQPKRKNQDLDPDQSITSSKNARR